MKTTKALIVTGIIVLAIAGSSLTLAKPTLTIDEYQTLIKIYNYEIERMGGKIVLEGTKELPLKGNVIKHLNARLLNTPQLNSVTINKETVTSAEYQLLKANLFEKVEKQNE